MVLLQPTSPMRRSKHIDGAVKLFYSSGADTVISVTEPQSHPYWCWMPSHGALVPYFSRGHIATQRNELPPAFVENGAIYVVRRDLLSNRTIYGDRVVGYLMDTPDSIDIDTDQDFELASRCLSNVITLTLEALAPRISWNDEYQCTV